MKTFLALLLTVVGVSAQPLLRSELTTNNPPSGIFWTNSIFSDLSFLSLADGNVPSWNSAAKKWTNVVPSSGGSTQMVAAAIGALTVTNIGVGTAFPDAAGGIGLKGTNSGFLFANSATPNLITYTNGQLLIAQTNQAGFSNFLAGYSLTLSNGWPAATNTIASMFMRFAVNAFQTGTGATNANQFAEYGYIPNITAVGTTNGEWLWITRSLQNGIPSTNMILTSSGAVTTFGGITASSGSIVATGGSLAALNGSVQPGSGSATGVGIFFGGSTTKLKSAVDGILLIQNAANADAFGISFGGTSQSNGLLRTISSSTGNSNMVWELRSGNTNQYGILTVGELRATNSISLTNGALIVGPSGAAVTNILSASATLDFPSTLAQTDSDLPITVTGAAPGDTVQLGTPTIPLTGSTYTAFASNDTVFVRFSVYGLAAKDPASGTFKVIVTKF